MKTEIESVWRTEQEILDVIHAVCAEHNLRYSLAYGTLLGAVRHKGFIPWDDDIDIIMPREDYETLRSIWLKTGPQGYILQDNRTNPDFTQNFMKIRKDHTTFLQDEAERGKSYHKGVFVDIFPGDRVAPGKIGRKIQYLMGAVNLLFSRGYSSGTGGLVGAVERILLKIPEKYYPVLRNGAARIIRFWNKRTDCMYFVACTINASRHYYSHQLFENLKNIEFNGKEYRCVSDTDMVLKVEYGDYMQLPPESERVWKHHPILIDFEHNYEELNRTHE